LLRQLEVSPYFTSASAPTLPSRNALPIAPNTSTTSNNVVVLSTPIHAASNNTIIILSTSIYASGNNNIIILATLAYSIDVIILLTSISNNTILVIE